MATSEFWLYQKRAVPKPWAIYIVKNYDRRDRSSATLDFTIFQEDIESPTHSKSFVGLHYPHARNYADKITCELADVGPVEEQDYSQVLREIERILS